MRAGIADSRLHGTAGAPPGVPARRGDSLTPPNWEIVSIAALVALYSFADLLFGQDNYEIVNFVGPLWLAAVLGLGAARMVLLDRNAMWAGLFWFRVSTAVYFGIGSIIHNYMNDYTLMQIWRFFYAEKEHIAKFNIIASLSVFCVIGATAILGRVFPPRVHRAAPASIDRPLLFTTALIFALCGYPVKYLITFPQAMGAYGDVILPGMLTMFEYCVPVALFLLTLWSLRFSPAWFPAMVALLAVDVTAGFLRFSKTDVLLPLLMFILALLHRKASVFRLSVAAVAFLVVYQGIEPAASYGRQELSLRYGSIRTATFGERLEIMAKYWTDSSVVRTGQEFQGALARIAYVHSAAPAIALYDRGAPGESLADIYAVLIPRFLWPGKPVFDHGARYTRLINGSDTSSTWMGYFGEAYWNLGWAGIPLLMIPLGAVLFAFGRYAQFVLQEGKWLHFPSVFLGMFLGIRVDGSLVTEVFITSVIAIVYHQIANAGTSFLCRVVLTGRGRPAPGIEYGKRMFGSTTK